METLINFRPQTTTEKLLWERQANKILSQGLREKEEEISKLRSSLLIIDKMKKENDLMGLILKNIKLGKLKKEQDDRIRDLKREVERLIIKLAKCHDGRKIF